MTVRAEPIRQFEKLAALLFQPAIVLLILAVMLGHSLDNDSWWHLAQGRWMVENGCLYTADTFSFTRTGAPWNNPGNLYDISLYLVFSRFGYLGVDVVSGLLLATTFLILWNHLKTTPLRRLVLVGSAILLTISYWSARPAILSLLFSSITMVSLEDFRQKKTRQVFLLPLLTLLWANIHAFFIIGLILTGIALLDHLKDLARLKRLGIVLLLMVLAGMVNPSGYKTYVAPLHTIGRTAEQLLIMEWQSPNFHQPYAQIFLVAILFTLTVLAYTKRPFPPSRLILLAVFLGLALIANRNISFFGIIAPIAWYDLLGWRKPEESAPIPQAGNPIQAGVSLALFLVSLAFISYSFKAALATPIDSTKYPVGAAAYIRLARPQGQLFNGYNWGGYLTWDLPEYPVFVDGRSDIYGDEIIQQSVTLEQTQPGWQTILTEWNIHLVLTAANSPLGSALQAAGWKECYHDQLAAVLMDASQCP